MRIYIDALYVYIYIFIFFSLPLGDGDVACREGCACLHLPALPFIVSSPERPEPGNRRRRQLWAGAVRLPRKGARRTLTTGEERVAGGRRGWRCLCPRG